MSQKNIAAEQQEKEELIWKTKDEEHHIPDMDDEFLRTAFFHCVKMMRKNSKKFDKLLQQFQHATHEFNYYHEKAEQLSSELSERGITILEDNREEMKEELS